MCATGTAGNTASPRARASSESEIDAAIGKLLVGSVTPMALEMALAVQQEIAARLDEVDRLRHRQVERAQYESDHARIRYMQVDAANRLVADSLEAEWNVKLRALGEAQEEYQRQRSADQLAVDEDERQRILALATDFPAIWCDPNTPQRERKRMLALLIEDITLIKRREVTAAVRFRGGATTTLTLPRPLTAQQLRATHPEVRQQIDALLNEYTDAQVARVLNGRELRTGAGDAFDGVSVQWVRCSAKLKSLKQRLLDAGWLTRKQIADQLGVSRTELGRLRGQGWLEGRICSERGEWLYLPPDRTPTENQGVPVAVATLDNIAADVRREMQMLIVENTDAHVAHMLNERGLRTSTGGAFNPVIVRWVRRSANLESLKDRLIRAGMLTIHQIVAMLGIDRSTVLAWRGNGRLNGRVCSDRGEWLYWLPDGRKPPSTRRTVTSPARGAV